MTRSERLIDRAMDNPAATFEKPVDVVTSAELTREEKIEVLRRWEYDARQVEVAQEENMIARTPGVLGEVLKALQALRAVRRTSAPTKSGGA